MVLSWFENHTSEDTPPEHIWEDPDGLEEWWKRVRERKMDEIGGGRRRSSSGDDDDDGFVGNELANAFKE